MKNLPKIAFTTLLIIATLSSTFAGSSNDTIPEILWPSKYEYTEIKRNYPIQKQNDTATIVIPSDLPASISVNGRGIDLYESDQTKKLYARIMADSIALVERTKFNEWQNDSWQRTFTEASKIQMDKVAKAEQMADEMTEIAAAARGVVTSMSDTIVTQKDIIKQKDKEIDKQSRKISRQKTWIKVLGFLVVGTGIVIYLLTKK